MQAHAIPGFDKAFTRIFGKPSFASEAERQERIGKLAKSIEQDLYASLLTNEKDAFDVCDDIPGNMTTEQVIKLTRAFLRNDLGAMAAIFGAELDEAVKRIAEQRAIQHVEEHE